MAQTGNTGQARKGTRLSMRGIVVLTALAGFASFNIGCQVAPCTVDEDCKSPSLVCRNSACVANPVDLVVPPQGDMMVLPMVDLTAEPADLTPPCPMGETLCNGACKNTATDAFHCGDCGQACFQGQTCVAGVCTSPMGVDAGPLVCPPGHADCDGDGKNCETDTNASDSNCGACGMACNVVNGEKCSQGMCSTPADLATSSDLATSPDLVVNPDLATSADLLQAADGGMAATDGASPPDLATPPNDQAPAQNACDPQKGLKLCLGGCVDISSDGKNCNGCNNICQPGSVCSNGACVPGCKPGETSCNGACTDLQTDGRHCGGCGNSCAVKNLFCINGACGNACLPGQTVCGLSGCVDQMTDQFNCGGCNKACPQNQLCQNGACKIAQCQPGRVDCNGSLLDGCETHTAIDVMNCGKCGSVCQMTHGAPFCWDGRCQIAQCFGTWLDCNNLPGDDCEVNGATNLTHCGACGNTCPMVLNGTRGCSAGVCGIASCNAGFADCNASAKDGCEINTTNDTANCGACAKVCRVSNATPSCTAGACVVKKCDFGWEDCNGVAADGCEVNVVNNAQNCGACGKQCTQGVCQVGQCVPVCGQGFTLCNGGCVNTSTDTAHCGGCNKPCGQGQTCSNGACQAPQPGFSAKLEVSAANAAEIHVYTQNAGNGSDHFGVTVFLKTLNQVEACTWGIEIAARVDKSINMMMPWYGCDQGAPSLNTITVKINGVVTAGTFVKHPWTCNGGGEGNLYFSPKQLGCP